MRKDLLITGEVYHVFTRSIANFQIFNNRSEFERIFQLLKYYQTQNEMRLSYFIKTKLVETEGFNNALNIISKDNVNLVQIICYCLMPTHIHLILKQLVDEGISTYVANILNGYTRFFNSIHKRKGPLWESKFNNVLVENDEQLLHLTRYVNLNPVTAFLVKKPDQWNWSSYNEYLSKDKMANKLCKLENILEIESGSYRKFVNDQISYQRELAKIKRLVID